jgi:hypothetical protein
MARLAVFTFGNLHGEQGDDHAGAKEFWEAAPSVIDALQAAPGFLSMSSQNDPWGAGATPEFGDGRDVQTLSLWVDVESLFAASYGGNHLAAMKKRHEWFKPEESPSSVLWWVEDDHTPTRAEACERHRQLHEQGPTASAFNFRRPFDSDGHATKVDHGRVKEIGRRG